MTNAMHLSGPHTCNEMELAYERRGAEGAVVLQEAEGQDLRVELLERLSRGEHLELLLAATTYAQGPGVTNRKFTTFTAEALATLAETAAGTPFQRDHSLLQDDVGGFAAGPSSIIAPAGPAGPRALRESIRLVRPWAVRAALDGTMRRFSISWQPGDWADVCCTVCETPVLDCGHPPGLQLGEGVVHWEYGSAVWRERSVVVNPAVLETGPISWEQALADARRLTPPRTPKDTSMDSPATPASPDDAAVLRPHDDSGTDDAEVVNLRAENADLRATLREAAQLREELGQLRAENEERRVAERDAERDRTIAELCAAAKIRPGGAQEKLLRQEFDEGLERGRQLAQALAENEPLIPVGGGTQHFRDVDAASAPGQAAEVNYQSLFDSLPEHIREAAGPHAGNPERFLRLASPALQAQGIDLPPF